MLRWVSVTMIMASACGGAEAELDLRFGHPVLEARTRTVVRQTVGGRSCSDVWSVPAREVAGLGGSVQERVHAYPVRPSDLLEEGGGDPSATLHIYAQDAEGLVVARGCSTLEEAETEGTLLLRALPVCASPPPAADLGVVYDASAAMGIADVAFGGVAGLFFEGFIAAADFPPDSTFSLVSYGPTTPTELVTSVQQEAVSEALFELQARYEGDAELYTGVLKATRGLRDRASCRRLPALLAVAAGDSPSGGTSAFSVEAALALDADPDDRTDDIFAFGVGLTAEALEDLNSAIPEALGETRGARTARTLSGAFEDASQAIRLRLNPP